MIRHVGSQDLYPTSILRASSSAGKTSGQGTEIPPSQNPDHTQSSTSILSRCPHQTNLVNAVFADLAFHNVIP